MQLKWHGVDMFWVSWFSVTDEWLAPENSERGSGYEPESLMFSLWSSWEVEALTP